MIRLASTALCATTWRGLGPNQRYRGASPTPVPAPPDEPTEPVTPDSPEPNQEPMPTYEDPPPVKPIA